MAFPVKDPMDTLMMILAVILLIPVYLSFRGYLYETCSVLALLLALAYAKAPRRMFQTAEQVSEGVNLAGKGEEGFEKERDK